MKTTLRKPLVTLLALSAVSAVIANSAVAQQPTPEIRRSAQRSINARITGVAFEDRNANGIRDAGEPALPVARYKITAGGAPIVVNPAGRTPDERACGAVFGERPYGVDVRPGIYFVIPIAGPGQYPTRPVIRVELAAQDVARVDLPFGINPIAVAENCGIFEPPITARDPFGLVETLTANGIATLPSLIRQAGLFATLSGGAFTIFAPTDLAFGQFTEDELNELRGDRARLRSILTYHVVPGVFNAASVVNATSLPTVNGKPLPVRVEGGEVFVGDA
ncbi:MAG: fasciclin domain-containing protein, partial [Thermoflexales bacterium]|nr:fasciclin domain-containing protein [Thermoflexales bacterium]